MVYQEYQVNNNSLPGRPFQPDFANGDWTASYLSLFYNKYPQTTGNFIDRKDYPNGYCLFIFNLQDVSVKDIMPKERKGHTHFEVKFVSSLSDPVTIILYSKFSALVKIDKTRNIILS